MLIIIIIIIIIIVIGTKVIIIYHKSRPHVSQENWLTFLLVELDLMFTIKAFVHCFLYFLPSYSTSHQ